MYTDNIWPEVTEQYFFFEMKLQRNYFKQVPPKKKGEFSENVKATLLADKGSRLSRQRKTAAG